ncbi:hypothetical protein BDV95DRAFT_661569 [Massariosphaeria phaeospora]|uniref:DUF7918 domain-containing protein n=1 Tax=Massariosphaeria phaeospora TaxID=100035 RepID=A0A7C8I939_9PLEO|nr:hypothetical protein BDV95DRAFT_661569 [Massariosphaeria phaeospora]
MAILPDCPGLEVKIVVDGEPLKEYEDDGTPAPKSVTKYIEAVSDAKFEINYAFNKDYPHAYDVRVVVKLDGQQVDDSLDPYSTLFRDGGHTVSGATSCLDGKWFMADFRFSQLTIDPPTTFIQPLRRTYFFADTDSGRHIDKRLSKKLSTAGEISIAFQHIKNIRASRSSGKDIRIRNTSQIGNVPEKAVQVSGLSHYARYVLT